MAAWSIAGVAERMSEKIRSIVFLDAFLPRNSDATIDLVPPAGQQSMRKRLAPARSVLQPRSAEAFAVNEADRAWIDRLRAAACQGHARKRSRSPALTSALHARPTSARAGYPNAAFDAFYARVLRAIRRWRTEAGRLRARLHGGPAPHWLAERLLAAAGGARKSSAAPTQFRRRLRLVSAQSVPRRRAMRC